MQEDSNHLTKKERRLLKRQEREQALERERWKRKMKRKAVWPALALGVLAVLAGVVFGGGGLSLRGSSSLANPVSALDRIKGGMDASITLVEYSDFQCPACASFYPIVKQLGETFADDLKIVYRHFPLSRIHKNASLAARSAEAAGEQGKFWEMHDMLFEHQREWSEVGSAEARAAFVSYAKSLGLDINQFETSLDSEAVKGKVDGDFASGLRSHVNATPTFFLNGEKISTPRSYEKFEQLILESLGTQF
jgi:protein-disulfide isomerase